MSNTFINTDLVARDAAILLASNCVVANLSNRDYEVELQTGKIGDTIRIKQPVTATARDFIDDGSVTVSDITETSTSLQLTEQPYLAHTLTSEELTCNVDDFNALVTLPMVQAIIEKIDAHIIQKAAAGYMALAGLSGTIGTSPTTLAHYLAGRKIIVDNKVPLLNMVSIIDSTAEVAYLQLAQFTSSDYGVDRPNGLRDAGLGKMYGAEWYTCQNAGAFTRGDVTAATHTATSYLAGVSTITVDDAGGTSTGTIKKGASFTLSGLSTTYYVTADSTASGGEFSVGIYPVLEAGGVGNNIALTWKSAAKCDLLYRQESLGVAIVAPAALAIGSSVGNYRGYNIRVTMSTSAGPAGTLSDTIVMDTFLGAEVLQGKAGVVFQG